MDKTMVKRIQEALENRTGQIEIREGTEIVRVEINVLIVGHRIVTVWCRWAAKRGSDGQWYRISLSQLALPLENTEIQKGGSRLVLKMVHSTKELEFFPPHDLDSVDPDTLIKA
jgi:hypothetical protein